MSLYPKKDRQIAHLDYLLRKAESKIKLQQEFIQELIKDKQILQRKNEKLWQRNQKN